MKCLIVDDDAFSRAVMEEFVAKYAGLTLVGSCESAIDAANVLQTEEVDLIFLDVEMPEMSGIEWIGHMDDRPQVILVTGKEGYALEAFEEEVTDYLLKPVTYARFLKAMRRVQRPATPADSPETAPSPGPVPEEASVFIKVDGLLVQLNLSDVCYIEAQKDYVLIYTDSDKYLVYSTMKSIERKLPPRSFIRVHRSYIVRIDKIKDIDEATLVIGRSVIPIGRSYRSKLIRQLNTL